MGLAYRYILLEHTKKVAGLFFSGGKMWGSELSGYKTEIEMCNNSNDKSAIQCNLVLTS